MNQRSIIYYIDINNYEKIKNFIDKDNSTKIEIQLRNLKELLDNLIVEDFIGYEIKEIKISSTKTYQVTINKFISDKAIERIEEYNAKNILKYKKR